MPVCSGCGFESPDDARFCGGCGERLTVALACPACAATHPSGHRFCSDCGAALEPSSPPRDPRDYTPRHLAERILTSRAALEGERKHVTVLFADIRGSTGLTSALDPEEWHRILERFFEILTSGVHRFEGTVNQYTGDGIMALFGAPIAHEDHAQRACWAALQLRTALRAFTDELRRREINLSVRIGLNSGEVVVGRIGDDLRMDYTAQGHTVSLAQRAESLAEAGGVLLTADTAALVKGYFQLRSLGETRLRGIETPMELFELEGVGPLRTRLDASRAAGFTRFVGREAELAQLESSLDRALEGDDGVVGVVGEAGVGKSRLCDTFAEHVRARGIPVYETRCPSHASGLSGYASRELVRSFCGVAESDSPAEARRKIAGTLVLIDESLHGALPVVFGFAGVAEPGQEEPDLDGAARRRRLMALLRAITERRSEQEAAVMLVDDLHWVDPESDEFLADMIAATRGTRTLVLMNFRPEYEAGWMTGSRYQQIALRPFGRAESEALLDALLGRDPSLSTLREELLGRAGGNPFFAEELATSLFETGVVEGERGACRLVGEARSLDIPETVHGVLAARIDRLQEREKRLLQTASVIGRDFALDVLEAAAELPEAEIAEALDHLLRAEFVHELQLFPQAEYRFKHALTQEVAYAAQLSDARRTTHARVAAALAAAAPPAADARTGEIAQHLEQAGDADAAADWYTRAAEGSPRLSLAAGRYWEKVLASTGESVTADTRRLRLRALTGSILSGWADEETPFEDHERLYQEGVAIARELGDRNAEIFLESAFALLALRWTEDVQIEHVERALALVDEDTPRELHISILQRLSWTHAWFGDAARAEEQSRAGLELGNGDAAADARLFGFNGIIALQTTLANAQFLRGRLAEARTTLAHAFAMARDHGDPMARYLCHWTRACLHHIEGETEDALDQVEAGRRVIGEMDSPNWEMVIWIRELNFLADDRRWADLHRAFEVHRSVDPFGAAALRGYSQIFLLGAAAAIRLGVGDERRDQAERLLEHISAMNVTNPITIVAHARLLWALRGLDGADGVARLLEEADAELIRRDWIVHRMFVFFDRAEIEHTRGDSVARDAYLERAIAIAREIEAPRRAAYYEERLAEWRAGS